MKFVRENNYRSVLGNHEYLAITDSQSVINAYKQEKSLDLFSMWYSNGGIKTLLSYKLIKLVHGKPEKVEMWQEPLQQFEDDLKWFESLPNYIELDIKKQNKPVVISHGSISSVWGMRNVQSMFKSFFESCMYSRRSPDEDSKIFNIYGHTPEEAIDTTKHYINVDTGCYLKQEDFQGKLSAYCIESDKVISVR